MPAITERAGVHLAAVANFPHRLGGGGFSLVPDLHHTAVIDRTFPPSGNHALAHAATRESAGRRTGAFGSVRWRTAVGFLTVTDPALAVSEISASGPAMNAAGLIL